MARTPLELPDAPAAGTSAGAAADADDLLSQLAGNEIDRLLQEAESSADASPIEPSIETPKPDPKVSSEPEDLQHNAEPALGVQIDNLLAEIQNPAPEPEPAAPVAEVTTTDSTTAETTGDAAERTALLDAAGFSNGQDVAATETQAPTTEGVLEDPPIGQERSALLEAAGFEAPDGTPISPKPDEPAQPEEPPLPKYLQPLVWINSPLRSRPPIVRQLIGGAAIVTLVNALAVIGYVLLFKKH